MTAPKTVDRAGAAELLGLAERTVSKYAAEVWPNGVEEGLPFPQPDEDGQWQVEELTAWKAARPGRGRKAGVVSSQPCEECGTQVPRRFLDEPTGEYVCKPDLLARDRVRRAEADTAEAFPGAAGDPRPSPMAADDPRHGTQNGYKLKCRCDLCKAANARRNAALQQTLAARGLPTDDPRHGTVGGYTNYECRCERCHAANRASRTRWRRKRREEQAKAEG